MKKTLIVMLAFMTLLLSMISCGGDISSKVEESNISDYDKVTLDNVLSIANMTNESKSEIDISQDVNNYVTDYEKEFSDEEVEALINGKTQDKSVLTEEEAYEDCNMLIRIFRSSYGAFGYFGGDNRFDKALDDILSDINKNVYSGKITREKLLEIIDDDLNFIVDRHLSIYADDCNERFSFDKYYTYYDSLKRVYRHDNIGYFMESQDIRWYLDEDITKEIRYTISDEGEIVYGIFYICLPSEEDSLPSKITLHNADNTKSKDIEVEWNTDQGGEYSLEGSAYEYSENNNIPYIHLRDMDVTDEYQDFINTATKIKDKNYSILDLRGNYGGILTIPILWLEKLTGEIVYPNCAEVYRQSNLIDKLKENAYKEIQKRYGGSFEDIIEKYPSVAELQGFYGINETDGQYNIFYSRYHERNQVMTILTDKQEYSCGEDMLLLLETVKNTLRVGTNTNGCLTTVGIYTGESGDLALPNSGIKLSFGTALRLMPFLKNFDKKGILPDIYVCDEDATKLVYKMYEYYGCEN